MSSAELIEAVLLKAIKVAEIDPALQWGILGAGVGGAGGLVKSLASGKSLKDVLLNSAGGAALGGGIGLSGAAGASILGAKPPGIAGALTPQRKSKGDFNSAAGTGILGAVGLGVGANMEHKRDRNEALRKFIEGGGSGKDLFGAKGEAGLDASQQLKDFIQAHNGNPEELLRSTNADVDNADKLINHIKDKTKGFSTKPSGILEGIKGESPQVSWFKKLLEHSRANASKPEIRVMAERILDKIKGTDLVKSKRFAPSARPTQFLKNFKGLKNLGLAAGAIGLGSYGLTGLGEKLWGPKS